MVENYTKGIKESVYHRAVVSVQLLVTQCLEKR